MTELAQLLETELREAGHPVQHVGVSPRQGRMLVVFFEASAGSGAAREIAAACGRYGRADQVAPGVVWVTEVSISKL